MIPQSPGWWLNRLARRLWWPLFYDHYLMLDSWYRGEPPMPFVKPEVRESIVALLGLARSNFASLIVESLRERIIPVGLHTASETVDKDDQAGWDRWQDAGLHVIAPDVHRWMLTCGRTYAIVGDIDPETNVPTITHEDPMCAITEQDPVVPWRSLAGLKFRHDIFGGRDLLYLYLPGRIYTAWRECGADGGIDQGLQVACARSFDPASWSWVTDAAGNQAVQVLPSHMSETVPMVEFENYGGVGEFELHLDLLRRIQHTVLQRVIIAVMQAFRQRAIKGLPQKYPAGHKLAGQDIDYSDILVGDPGAFWQLPKDTDLWESGQVDLTGVLTAAKDDITHLAAVTRTPMHVLMPEGQNQSAEGASLAREGQVFKAQDRLKRLSMQWARVQTISNLWLGEPDPVVRPSQIIWVPPQRYSLSERAAAAAQAKDVPWRTKMIKIWEFEPDEVDRMESERAEDMLLEARTTLMIRSSGDAQVQLPAQISGPPETAPIPASWPKPETGPAPGPRATPSAPAPAPTPAAR